MGVKNSNCWKYFLSRAPSDILETIRLNTGACPIYMITGKSWTERCENLTKRCGDFHSCEECAGKWLNEKSES